MKETEMFALYIPTARRKTWGEFRERLENEGKHVCDVIMDLVDEYLGKKDQ